MRLRSGLDCTGLQFATPNDWSGINEHYETLPRHSLGLFLGPISVTVRVEIRGNMIRRNDFPVLGHVNEVPDGML